MALSFEEIRVCLEILFDANIDPSDDSQLAEAAVAFQELAAHYVDRYFHPVLPKLRFDRLKLAWALKKFYRDAFGVENFERLMMSLEKQGVLNSEYRGLIEEKALNMGIRINSDDPKKTRIAAAFSLWMSTMRPIYLHGDVPDISPVISYMDACITFWIATRYLSLFGEVKIGDPTLDVDDFRARLHRIRYDLTFRDLTLSSLECMYAFIFRPPSLKSGNRGE